MLAHNLANAEREGTVHAFIMPMRKPPVKFNACIESAALTLIG